MPAGEEHSFGPDDPVARYWLHNCVGFEVRGLRGGRGVVREIGIGADGVAVLGVHRHLSGTTLVPAARVESVDPWDETIVLRSPSRESRQRRAAETRRLAGVAVAASRAATIVAAAATRRFLALVARFLLALAALVRTHAPDARRGAGRVASTLALLGRAYAIEAARAYRVQRAAVAAWREERRRAAWGDESPLTRAGADDDVDARSEKQVRR